MTDPLLGTTGWVFREPSLGQTPIAATAAAGTVAANMGTVAAGTLSSSPGAAGRSTPGRLGSIAKAYHPTFGEGEFIYLLGVASTVVGLTVRYNATTFQTTISPTTANTGGPVAVAMSANVANQYGWYQIGGLATVLKTAVKVTPGGTKIYQSGTAGRWMQTSASGNQILGASPANMTTVTSTTSTVVVLINRPSRQGQIT